MIAMFFFSDANAFASHWWVTVDGLCERLCCLSPLFLPATPTFPSTGCIYPDAENRWALLCMSILEHLGYPATFLTWDGRLVACWVCPGARWILLRTAGSVGWWCAFLVGLALFHVFSTVSLYLIYKSAAGWQKQAFVLLISAYGGAIIALLCVQCSSALSFSALALRMANVTLSVCAYLQLLAPNEDTAAEDRKSRRRTTMMGVFFLFAIIC